MERRGSRSSEHEPNLEKITTIRHSKIMPHGCVINSCYITVVINCMHVQKNLSREESNSAVSL